MACFAGVLATEEMADKNAGCILTHQNIQGYPWRARVERYAVQNKLILFVNADEGPQTLRSVARGANYPVTDTTTSPTDSNPFSGSLQQLTVLTYSSLRGNHSRILMSPWRTSDSRTLVTGHTVVPGRV